MRIGKSYIGLSTTFHDSAIAIVNNDGEVVFAEATERYLQYKTAFNISPDVAHRVTELIDEHCDPNASLVVAHCWSGKTKEVHESFLEDVELNAMNSKKLFGQIPFYLNRNINFSRMSSSLLIDCVEFGGRNLEFELRQTRRWSDVQIAIKRYEHHVTHAATACFTSPHENGVCVVVDGFGESTSTDVFAYDKGKLSRFRAQPKRVGSLGFFYMWICQACGFKVLSGEEWKVMGLAPYGKLNPELYQLLRECIVVEDLSIFYRSDVHVARVLEALDRCARKNNEPLIEFADLAHTGQAVFQDVLFELINNVYDKGVSDNLILTGGCFLNSSATGLITSKTKFDNAYVYSAPGDDGNALGAALLAYRADHADQNWQHKPFQSPYLGSQLKQETIANTKRYGGLRVSSYEEDHKLCERAAQLLAEGKVIAWVQGRAEYGPRALGNRSILADPRSADVKDKINLTVKFREEYRPFAPSILHEFGPEYFQGYEESPYMERTLKFKPEVLDKVPGVVHVDSTGRLQTVKQEWNKKYYTLIKEFYKITNIPLVLNTSFNVMGKPIVHSMEDALAVFCTSGLDALVIGNDIFEK